MAIEGLQFDLRNAQFYLESVQYDVKMAYIYLLYINILSSPIDLEQYSPARPTSDVDQNKDTIEALFKLSFRLWQGVSKNRARKAVYNRVLYDR